MASSSNSNGRRGVQPRPPSSHGRQVRDTIYGSSNTPFSACNAAAAAAAAAATAALSTGTGSHSANSSAGVNSDRADTQAPAVAQSKQEHTELWERVVLPAVTWLYGWIEWHVQSAHVPSMVEHEHREAFASATEVVTNAMRSQPDRLASCIWRAMIALLMHFVSHMEPVQRNLAELRQQHTEALAEIETLQREIESLAAVPGMQRGGGGRNQAAAPMGGLSDPDRPDGSRMRMRRQSSKPVHFESAMREPGAGGRRVGLNEVAEVIELPATEESGADGAQVPPGAQRGRRGIYFPGRTPVLAGVLDPNGRADADALEEEVEELRDKLVEVQRDAIVERKANVHLQSSLKAARTKIEKLRNGQDSDDEEESDYDSEQDEECSDDDEDVRDAKAARRRARQAKHERREAAEAKKRALANGRNGRRSSLQEIEGAMLERVEKDLNNEKHRRMFLERLRAELMNSLGADYIAKMEEQLRSGGAEADSPKATLAFKATCVDAVTQFVEADSNLAQQISGDAEGGDSEDESDSSPKARKKGSPKGAKGVIIKMLNMRQIAWTIQTIFEEKTKRDTIDELEHRPKLRLQTFVPDFFVNRHGLRDMGEKYHANFRAGTMAAADGGNRKALIFSWLCGYMAFEGDRVGALTEASAQTFLLELERKAIVAAGETKGQPVSELVWMPLDRAIELMRKEFSYAKVMDISKCTIEIEQLLRLPDEIHEINKAKDGQSNFVPKAETEESPVARRASVTTAEVPTVRSLPPGFDVVLFREKPHEEQSKLLRRREDALVQNKVLRAVARRGISLRELFSMLDDDDSGEIDPQEFIKGIQGLEGQLTDAQCERLMEITDTDKSNSIDFNELTHALQKRDLRVEMSEFLIICLRFFSAEMQRTSQVLHKHFSAAVAKASGKPMPVLEEGSQAREGDGGSDGNGATGKLKMNAESVKLLLKNLDAPFQAPVVQKLLGEMVRFNLEGTTPVFTRKSATATDAVSKNAEVSSEAFVKVVMQHGFHALASPAFKESGVHSTANIMLAVNAFAKKLPKLSHRHGARPGGKASVSA